jgi:K+-transporting ATPase ATPase B chain
MRRASSALSRCASQARPAQHGAESGDVRRPHRLVYTTLVLARDIATAPRDWLHAAARAVALVHRLFANFAEAMAEGAARRRPTRCVGADADDRAQARQRRDQRPLDTAPITDVPAPSLRRDDRVLCLPGDVIPGDGEVVEGVASVDEAPSRRERTGHSRERW